MSEMDAWFAGFMDGEGTFAIQEKAGRGHSTFWVARASVCNTDESVILHVRDGYGGRLYCNEFTSSRLAGHRPTYTLWWEGTEAAQIARATLPFLQIKADRAALVLSFVEHQSFNPNPGRKGHPAHVTAYRKHLSDRCRSLNSRGVAA